ncbi:GNAT family N-acetyltransferase [Streptomyces sp. NPDC006296]|uniref:GNAT family N-acetyltransferase n=1 Tax=Streptomyces sp. NPDC006296 TaxID=3156746 RepID=UPI0033A1C0FC
MRVRLVDGAGLAAYGEGIRRVYADAFSAPPWDEDPASAGRYTERLAEDAERPGFTAALALDGDTVRGFATAWTTPGTLPSGSGSGTGAVAEALGPERFTRWLCGALKVDELAVSSHARRTGLGAGLLSAVTRNAPDGRCWLLTSVRAEPALRLYRRTGWYRIPVAVPGRAGLTVLLGPGHPAAAGTHP